MHRALCLAPRTAITTVGYGHQSIPKETGFQCFTVLYIFVGIAGLTIVVRHYSMFSPFSSPVRQNNVAYYSAFFSCLCSHHDVHPNRCCIMLYRWHKFTNALLWRRRVHSIPVINQKWRDEGWMYPRDLAETNNHQETKALAPSP